jgi:tetratricopeptide (TPR) repeat protein
MNLQQLEVKLARRPHSPLFARLADLYLKDGKVREAKELCASGLQKYPAYSTASIVLARCFIEEGDIESAQRLLGTVVRGYPDSGVLRELLAICESGLIAPASESVPVPEPVAVEAPPVESVQPPEADAGVVSTTSEAIMEEVVPRSTATEVASSVIEAIVEEAPSPAIQPEVTSPAPEVVLEETPSPATEPEITSPIAEVFTEEIVSPESEPVEAIPIPHATIEEVPPQEIAEEPIPQEPQPLESSPAAPVPPTNENPVELVENFEASLPELPSDAGEGRIISKTLAEIYVAQGAYDEAIITYRLLKQKRPEQSNEFDVRIRELVGKNKEGERNKVSEG